MNEVTSAWQTFYKTGKISDYLIYKSQSKMMGENSFFKPGDYQVLRNENSNQRNNY